VVLLIIGVGLLVRVVGGLRDADPGPAPDFSYSFEDEPSEVVGGAVEDLDDMELPGWIASPEEAFGRYMDAGANEGAVPVTLGAGAHTVGVDVAPGRYQITSAEPGVAVEVRVLEPWDNPARVSEWVGGEDGVPHLTVTLAEGGRLGVDGPGAVLAPVAYSAQRTTLTTGDWLVGVDIAPGLYVVSDWVAETDGSVVVTEQTDVTATRSFMTPAWDEAEVVVEEGQIVWVTRTREVTFHLVDMV
jgi:hypothetical protein